MKVLIETYGCAANRDDTAIMKGILKQGGHSLINNLKGAEIVIINTCIAKGPTESKIVHRIREIKNNYPKKKLIIAGCMPEAEYKICKTLFPEVSLINTFHIKQILKVINSKKRIELLGKEKEIKLNLPKEKIPTIQIAQGCSGNCTYCSVKLAKGELYSFPEEKILKELKGKKIIHLTATDTGCYGKDIGSSLTKLLNKIISLKGDFKLKVGMMNPENVSFMLNDLIEIYKSKNVVKFLHVPIQSGSDKVLREMNRRYTVKDIRNIFKEFRKNIGGINIATDVICGYPTETEEDFKETLELIKELKPEVLNISKFFPRPNTAASKLKQLPSEIVKKRSITLTDLYKKIKAEK